LGSELSNLITVMLFHQINSSNSFYRIPKISSQIEFPSAGIFLMIH
jgi:hypothetical protein